MNRLLKIIISICAIIIGLIIAAVIILPLVINPNDFKPEIQSAVKDATGREIVIEGDLDLSVFPWVGISTGKITLSNAKGFSAENFAEIEESNIRVKLIPLLSKELEVSRITLKGLVLNLAKNKQGISNWDDLTKKEKTPSPPSTDTPKEQNVSPLAALAIGGLSIEHAKISWDDQQQGNYTEINDVNFSLGKITFDQAIKVTLALTVINKEPAITEKIKFSTDFFINEALDNFKLTDIKLESTTTGKDIPGETLKVNLTADIALDLTQQILNISGLNLNTGALTLSADIKGTQIKDSPAFAGPVKIHPLNLAKFMQSISIPLPAMQGSNALNKLSASFLLQATTISANINDLIIKLDDTTINGFSKISNFSKPAITFNFDIDTLDVDQYLAPKKAGSASKTIATPASAAAASAGLFPIKMLRELNANGQVNIAKLKANQLKMQGVSLKLNAKQGVIKTQQNIKQLYQGSYKGNTTINVKNRTPRIALNERLAKVNIEPLLNDMLGEARMSGVVNANASLQGYGNSIQAIKSSLSGNLGFNFNNGVIRGFNLQKIIDNGKALLAGTPLPTDNKNDQTVFSVIKGTAKVSKGLLRNDDLYLEASKLRVNGKGTANLANDQIDYKVNAKLLKTIASATEVEKIKGMPIIIKVGGSFSKPSYQLDIATMLLEKNKDKINKKKDELLKKLDEKVGPGVGNLLRGFL